MKQKLTSRIRALLLLAAACIVPLACAEAPHYDMCLPVKDAEQLRTSVLAGQTLPASVRFLECRAVPSRLSWEDDEEACALQIDPSRFSQLVVEENARVIGPIPDNLPALVDSIASKLQLTFSAVYVFKHEPSHLHERYVYVSKDKTHLLFYTPVQRCFDLSQVL